MVKNLPTMWETWVRSLGWDDPLEKGKATHSSTLAWRSPWGCEESDMTERLKHTHTHTHTQYHWTKNIFSQSEYTHVTLLIQIYWYLSNDYYSILVTLGVRWWALLTWFSFSVICPCSLHPMKVLTHLKIFSFWCTLWTKLAGKKPILSWIFPWKQKRGMQP